MSVSLVTNGSQETTLTNAEDQTALLIPTVMELKMETVVALVTMPTLGIQFVKSTVALWLIVLALTMEMEPVNVTKVMNGLLEISSTNAEGQTALLIPTVMELKMETVAVLVIMPTLGIQSASLIAVQLKNQNNVLVKKVTNG